MLNLPAHALTPCNSWVVVSKETGQAVLETWSQEVVDAINRERYTVVTSYEWLVSLNRKMNPWRSTYGLKEER